MSCCSPADARVDLQEGTTLLHDPAADALAHAARRQPDGTLAYVLSVKDVYCGACLPAVERAVSAVEGVLSARANLSLKRVTVVATEAARPADILSALVGAGYPATPIDLGDLSDLKRDRQSTALLTAMAVAGFAAANIMLLSVSVWSGADDSTRDLFHMISGLIAVPTVAFSGRVFFRSAFSALSAGRMNMDVPIALALFLAVAMSIYESFTGGAEAYFDAAVTLTFFLLVGRYLDQLMRERARGAVLSLAKLAAKSAVEVSGTSLKTIPVDEVQPGMRLRVMAGERLPVDGRVVSGASDVDRSLVTGESEPVAAIPGMTLEAGTQTISGSIDIEALTTAENSYLAEIVRMMEAAETGRGRYTRIADRMARLYAPAVHLAAAVTFVGWMLLTGDWYQATTTAIAVLIVTCPCALGLAVPVVHVVGAGRLFRAGILMKDGGALERLADIDTAVFDKTGTLTLGVPQVTAADTGTDETEAILRALAGRSAHPVSKAIATYFGPGDTADIAELRELPGLGIEARIAGRLCRFGRPDFVAEIAATTPREGSRVAFAIEGEPPQAFFMAEALRPDAASAIEQLKRDGIACEILSGDAEPAVRRIADAVGVERISAHATPAGKIARIEALKASGANVLMVGDGLNDAPSLAAGNVSIAPASACDAGRLAADFVFTRDTLSAVTVAHDVAVRAKALAKGNFGLAIAYNCVAVPLAVAGFVTPLVAAIAMSTSSILVVANSLRLNLGEVRTSETDKRKTRPSRDETAARLGLPALEEGAMQ
ncbi:heavy metal translocating P-type ATPase [Jiella marina]|uniref:heavy metal translocating P-type ATPase n=1 Tax=Jiella sp. LLJ827 TaxID=2917712 RepID=UPI00210142ED|nr:heavy metal translocating P-type ATPase [Jiella sp. LLJ827]MCQ0988536.1 cadmium-translocating P-type ATPase [Jiella sp. LLJ827]